ncbi:hypothetical protein [Paracraurococcus ruber]|uniref:Uncharacterized protein n=1 Tax=Paracraurococcus ruber TaxID=77675 RepID=A0ABS1D737_9PROT|nr:hypothetical protein [Paracraurococcus ruber]MBK1662715.1 hypothetical protein [Paracraurococcus ruber]TDG14384.1 hypothetical protein E2C05_30030 [Paracraurococcus ruber]
MSDARLADHDQTPPQAAARQALRRTVDRILNGHLGGLGQWRWRRGQCRCRCECRCHWLPPPPGTAWMSLLLGLVIGGNFAALGAVALFLADPAPDRRALWLMAWGGGYFALVFAAARWATVAIRDAIARGLLPRLPGAVAEEIRAELEERFAPRALHLLSLGIAIACAALSYAVLRWDLDPAPMAERRLLAWPSTGRDWQALIVSLAYLPLYLTAALATNTARFYLAFTARLSHRALRRQIFRLDPALSSLVEAMARLGRVMFGFWLFVSLLVSTMLLLRSQFDAYVLLTIGIAELFSLVFSSFVLLRSEAHIAAAVAAARATTQRRLERETARLLDRPPGGTTDWTRFKELLALQGRLAAAGDLRNSLTSLISLLPAILTPLLGLLADFDKLAKAIGGLAK